MIQRKKINNLAEVCLVGIGVGGNYARCLVRLYHLYVGESNKIHKGGNYQDFVKWWWGGGGCF